MFTSQLTSPQEPNCSRFCREVLGLLEEALGFSPHRLASERFAIFRTMRVLRFVPLLGLPGILANALIAVPVILFAWNGYMLRGIWLQRAYRLDLSISGRRYLLGFLPNIVLMHPAILTCLLIAHAANWVLARLVGSPRSIPKSKELNVLLHLFGPSETRKPYTIPSSWRPYFDYLSLMMQMFYCVNMRGRFARVGEELATVFDNAEAPQISAELLSLHRRRGPASLAGYRIQLKRASLSLTMGDIKSAQALLASDSMTTKRSPDWQLWGFYHQMTLARLALHMHEYDRAIDIYDTLAFEIGSRLSSARSKISRGIDKGLYVLLLERAVERAACLRMWLGNHSQAVADLGEQIPLLGKLGHTSRAMSLRILALHTRLQLDPDAPLANDISRVYEEAEERFRSAGRVYPELMATGERDVEPQRLGTCNVIPMRQQSSPRSGGRAGHEGDAGGSEARPALILHRIQLYLGHIPDLYSLATDLLKLAMVASAGKRHDIARSCLARVRQVVHFDRTAFDPMLVRFFEPVFLIRAGEFAEARQALGDLETLYGSVLFASLYGSLLEAAIVVNETGSFAAASATIGAARGHLLQIQAQSALNGVKEAKELLTDEGASGTWQAHDESVSYHVLVAPLRFLFHLASGLASSEIGSLPRAIEDLVEALDWLDTRRLILETPVDIVGYKERYAWIYDIAVENCFDEERYADAVSLADRLKCLGMLLISHYHVLDIDEVTDRRLLLHYERLKRDIEHVRRTIEELNEFDDTYDLWCSLALEVLGMSLGDATTHLAILTRELDRTVVKIRKKHPRYTRLRERLMSDVAITEMRSPETVVAYYHFCRGRLMIFLLTAEGVMGFEGGTGKVRFLEESEFLAQVSGLVDEYCDVVSDAQSGVRDIGDACSELYDLCLAPVIGRLFDYSRVCVIADGPLLNLPFHALVEPCKTRYMVEFFEFCYLPNLQLSRSRPDESDDTSLNALIVADPETYGEFTPLPSAHKEAIAVSRSLKAMVLEGAAASKPAFVKAAPRCSCLHIAAHSVYDESFPYASYLRLTGWPDDDCRLRGYEIVTLKLKCRMCNLSSCESGRHHVFGQRETVSLGSCFLMAGAQTVVASLWPLLDEFAPVFMEKFYVDMKSAASSAALRRTQLAFAASDDYSHPRFWAPFYVTSA